MQKTLERRELDHRVGGVKHDRLTELVIPGAK